MKRRITIYSIYDKDDEFLFVGTAKECAKYLDTTAEYIRVLTYGTASGYYKGSKYKAYKVGREEKENKGEII